MKIVLAFQGFTTLEISKNTSMLVGKSPKDINIAIINEAYTGIEPGRDTKWLINELSLINSYFSGIISFVNIRAYDKNEI